MKHHKYLYITSKFSYCQSIQFREFIQHLLDEINSFTMDFGLLIVNINHKTANLIQSIIDDILDNHCYV